jgi:hypothetical protein
MTAFYCYGVSVQMLSFIVPGIVFLSVVKFDVILLNTAMLINVMLNVIK